MNEPLKSVSEHNAERIRARQEREAAARRTGVACPQCGKELVREVSYFVTLQHPQPTTFTAVCQDCELICELET